eukprot:COSAG03_NODE_6149_length_1106_cov_2.576763_2_plen_77_part_00
MNRVRHGGESPAKCFCKHTGAWLGHTNSPATAVGEAPPPPTSHGSDVTATLSILNVAVTWRPSLLHRWGWCRISGV